MNRSCWSSKRAVLAALTAAMFLMERPVSAQDASTAADPNRLSAADVAELQRLGVLREADQTVAMNLFATVPDPADQLLGATMNPVGETLRAQLDIPTGQGLLVTNLRAGGACAQAGLQENDILLSLAGKPLAAADDVQKHLKAAGESAVPLKILRAGKPITIQVRPIYRVTLGPAAGQETEYYIGVSIEPAGDSVRSQLGLPKDGQGVVVTEVVSGSPAEKAGVKKHDVVLEVGDTRILSPQDLAAKVKSIKDKPTTLKLVRAGKTLTIPVTAAVRKVEVTPTKEAFQLWMVDSERPRWEAPHTLYSRAKLATKSVNRDCSPG